MKFLILIYLIITNSAIKLKNDSFKEKVEDHLFNYLEANLGIKNSHIGANNQEKESSNGSIFAFKQLDADFEQLKEDLDLHEKKTLEEKEKLNLSLKTNNHTGEGINILDFLNSKINSLQNDISSISEPQAKETIDDESLEKEFLENPTDMAKINNKKAVRADETTKMISNNKEESLIKNEINKFQKKIESMERIIGVLTKECGSSLESCFFMKKKDLILQQKSQKAIINGIIRLSKRNKD